MLFCLLFIYLKNMIATPSWQFQLEIKFISKQKHIQIPWIKIIYLKKSVCYAHTLIEHGFKLNDYLLKMKTIHVLDVQPKK